jgi:hypothetical protein
MTASHGADHRPVVEGCAMTDVALANPFRQKNFDRLTDQLVLSVPEHRGDLAVDLPYDAIEIRSNDRIGNKIERNRSVGHRRLCAAAAANVRAAQISG